MMRFRTVTCCGVLAALFTGTSMAGPIERYRTGSLYCPRDRAATAPVLSTQQVNARAITLLPDLCAKSIFVSGCDAEPELINDQWRVYVQQYKLRAGTPDHSGLDHSYVILDLVGNCIANIPGTPLGALH